MERRDNAVVEIYLGEENRLVRTALLSALQDIKLAVREDFMECGPLSDAVRAGNADMVIIDAELPGGDARGLITAIRHDEIGPNPFVSVIATTWKNDPERIRALIDSGVDGLLVKPLSIGAVRRQLDAIIHRRRPFVVTSSYIGPDRRKDSRRQSNAPLIEVPNTLLAKINGTPIEPARLKRDIADTWENVLNERLRRNAFELSFMVKLIAAEEGANPPRLGRYLGRVQAVVQDTIDRIGGTPHAHNIEFCRSLLRVADTIAADLPDHSRRDIALLKPLSDAILLSFNPERGAEDMAREISGAIAGYVARQNRMVENS